MSQDQLRPANDPDYLLMTSVTEVIEEEIRNSDPDQALGRRFDYKTVTQYGMRRTQEVVQGARLDKLEPQELATLLGASWPEGFVFGALAYTQERRGRASEASQDRIALTNIDNTLASADGEKRLAIFSGVASMEALGYVSGMRTFKAVEALHTKFSDQGHQTLVALLAGHWLDGFFVGLVFEELRAQEKN